MKELKRQFYTEGFATIFYQKPKKTINKIKNKHIKKVLNILLTIIYTLVMIAISIIILYTKLK